MAFYFPSHIGANFIHHQNQCDSCPQQETDAISEHREGGESTTLQTQCHLELLFSLIMLLCLPGFSGGRVSAQSGESRQQKCRIQPKSSSSSSLQAGKQREAGTAQGWLSTLLKSVQLEAQERAWVPHRDASSWQTTNSCGKQNAAFALPAIMSEFPRMPPD